MKKLLVASAIVVASAVIAPANAGRIVIGVGDGYDDNYGNGHGDYYGDQSPDYYGDGSPDYYGDRPPDYYGNDYSTNDNGYRPRYYYRDHRHHCRTVLVEKWRHHHRVVERVRICPR
jgi:hypothetical protein